MKLVPNPEYSEAPYEMMDVDNDGNLLPSSIGLLPLRFKEEFINQVLHHLDRREWNQLRELAVPSHIKIL